MSFRILFLSGRLEDAHRISRMLQPLPLVLDHVENLRQARAQLQRQEYDVVLTEGALPDGTWQDALALANECPGEPALIVTDPEADAGFWSRALNLGAYDLL